METSSLFYMPQMKLCDMISVDCDLLFILQRLNIKLGFGDATIEEVCHMNNMSIDLFLIIANVYSFEKYVPNIDLLGAKDIPALIAYLRASHKHYSEKLFPHLHAQIHLLVKDFDKVNKKVINKFYDKYDAEVANHFAYEEEQVFPYIESLIGTGKERNTEYSIETFEENHSNIDEKLNDLKSIVIKYIPEELSCPVRYEVVYNIYKIERDLNKHSLIEDKLLIPLVSKLEHNEWSTTI